MSLSDPARQPRPIVRINGHELGGAIDIEVRSSGHYAADRFSARIALGPDPAFGAAFWASTPDVLAEVAASLDDGATSVSLVLGKIDQIELDVLRGVVRLEGRDLSAPLIEARTQETFSNRTSSEIASLLAQRHGLSADVTPTTTLVGRYYAAEHDSITLDQFSRATTEWDLLVFLARQEQFDLYVSGTTLSFKPQASGGAAGVILTPADLVGLRAERSMTLSRDVA